MPQLCIRIQENGNNDHHQEQKEECDDGLDHACQAERCDVVEPIVLVSGSA
eukprot:CAMPEP_0202417848 /NCGR_PEP_ID=MMETSP1128-20130828/44281_1 /ASSEMBLY_ACC=CAM_ASM_000463 /TAXON_ID=3047 /ORGANISM="Dunaliella tertiolecta, Strain CCMP1320" /LENGTH=50 /DNA_ID=CAMNT_0049025275 /DNA_START=142 /DNA_END=294 /DNA_ORIENTATION=-